jgi:hypothetical protein
MAILSGSWVVTRGWFDEFLKHGSADERAHSLDGDVRCMGAPGKGRAAAKDASRRRLFDGYRFCFHGTFGAPTKRELKALVQLGGAKVCGSPMSEPESGYTDMVVCGSQVDADGLPGMIRTLKYNWILDSISHYRPIFPVEEHPKLCW